MTGQRGRESDNEMRNVLRERDLGRGRERNKK